MKAGLDGIPRRIGLVALAGAFILLNIARAEEETRAAVQTLAGVWKLAVDPENKGRMDRWFESVRSEARETPMPGIIQQAFPAIMKSPGIGTPSTRRRAARRGTA